MAVASALGLDMACGCDEPLQDEGPAALRRGLEGRGGPDLVVVVQDSDAASTTAVSALQCDRVAVGCGEGNDGLRVGDRVGDAGHRGDLGPLGGGSGTHLVPEGIHGLRRGPDPGDAGIDDGAGEVGVLGQEPVTGVDGVGAGGTGHLEERRRISVGRPLGQCVGLIGELCGRAHQVLGRVRKDRRRSEIAGGSHDT